MKGLALVGPIVFGVIAIGSAIVCGVLIWTSVVSVQERPPIDARVIAVDGDDATVEWRGPDGEMHQRSLHAVDGYVFHEGEIAHLRYDPDNPDMPEEDRGHDIPWPVILVFGIFAIAFGGITIKFLLAARKS